MGTDYPSQPDIGIERSNNCGDQALPGSLWLEAASERDNMDTGDMELLKILDASDSKFRFDDEAKSSLLDPLEAICGKLEQWTNVPEFYTESNSYLSCTLLQLQEALRLLESCDNYEPSISVKRIALLGAMMLKM
jgi:hypothetical protein